MTHRNPPPQSQPTTTAARKRRAVATPCRMLNDPDHRANVLARLKHDTDHVAQR